MGSTAPKKVIATFPFFKPMSNTKAIMRAGASEARAGIGLISKSVRGSRKMLSHL